MLNVIPAVHNSKMVSLDIEMFGQNVKKLHRPHGTFAAISFVFDDDPEPYIITDVTLLPQAFENIRPCTYWVLANAVYDLRQLRAFFPIEPHLVWDVMLVEQVLWGGLYTQYSLAAMVRRYFSVILKKDKYESIESGTISAEDLQEYVADDSRWALKVAGKQFDLLSAAPDLWKVYHFPEAEMIWVVLDQLPVKVDRQAWTQAISEFQAKAESLKAELGINPNSKDQVIKFLKEKHNISVPNTREETLKEYDYHPVIRKILDARMYLTAISRYGLKWLDEHLEDDDLVYGSWKVIGTETGRQACSNPNLQNIPARKLPIFRTFFIPRYGLMIVSDLSQQEPRITAIEANDKKLAQIFWDHKDIHSAVASQMFHEEIHKGDPRRKIGKTTGLGIVYGLTAKGLSVRISEALNEGKPESEYVQVSFEEAQSFIDSYFDSFPLVYLWTVNQKQFGFEHEYVRTHYGRRVWMNIHNYQWQNNAINAPIQGGAGDLTKAWQVYLWRLCHSIGIQYPVCLVIHDELVLDVRPGEKDFWDSMLHTSLKMAQDTIYPNALVDFEFESESGDNWGVKQ